MNEFKGFSSSAIQFEDGLPTEELQKAWAGDFYKFAEEYPIRVFKKQLGEDAYHSLVVKKLAEVFKPLSGGGEEKTIE